VERTSRGIYRLAQVEGTEHKRLAEVAKRANATSEKAVELSGVTDNEVVPETVCQETQRIVERESVIRLSQKDARRILALINSPPKPNKALKDAIKAFRKRW